MEHLRVLIPLASAGGVTAQDQARRLVTVWFPEAGTPFSRGFSWVWIQGTQQGRSAGSWPCVTGVRGPEVSSAPLRLCRSVKEGVGFVFWNLHTVAAESRWAELMKGTVHATGWSRGSFRCLGRSHHPTAPLEKDVWWLVSLHQWQPPCGANYMLFIRCYVCVNIYFVCTNIWR